MRLPFGPKPRYSFVLTPEFLELGGTDPAQPSVRVPLPAGVLGPGASGDASSLQLHEASALKEAIASCLRQFGRTVRRAHLALGGLLIRTVSLPIPFVPPRQELELAVRAEAERYRVFSDTEVACDFALIGSDEEELTVLLAAGRRDYVDGVVAVFAEAGVSVESVEPVPLALIRSLGEQVSAAPLSGVVMVQPQQIHVSIWKEPQLQTWRTLYVQQAALLEGDPVALAETTIELQRTLLTLTAGPCYLMDVPEALKAAISVPSDVALIDLEGHASGGESRALLGAKRYETGQGPFAFDLRPDRLKPVTPAVSKGTWLLLGFAGMLIAALIANLWLSDRAKTHEAEADRLQEEMATLQALLTRPDASRESEGVLREALTRSEAVVALFRRFQESTPHDLWLSRTSLGADSVLSIEGYALSRQAPLLLAEALGQSRSLTEIEVPLLGEAIWQGESVYQFKLRAVFTPQGTFRP